MFRSVVHFSMNMKIIKSDNVSDGNIWKTEWFEKRELRKCGQEEIYDIHRGINEFGNL